MEQDYNRSYDYELYLVWAQDSEDEIFNPDTWEKSTPLIGMSDRRQSTINSLEKLRETINRANSQQNWYNTEHAWQFTSTATFQCSLGTFDVSQLYDNSFTAS